MLIQTDRLLRKFTFKLSTFLDWPALVSALETILVVFVDRLRLHTFFLGLNCESADTKLEKILWPVFVSIRFFRRLTSRSFFAFTRLLSQLKFLGGTWSSVSSLTGTGPWMSACRTMSLPAFSDRWLGGEKLRFELLERSVELAVHREVSDRDICELSVLSFLGVGCLETE